MPTFVVFQNIDSQSEDKKSYGCTYIKRFAELAWADYPVVKVDADSAENAIKIGQRMIETQQEVMRRQLSRQFKVHEPVSKTGPRGSAPIL